MQFDIAVLKMHDFEFWEKTAAKIIGEAKMLTYEDLSPLPLELALEKDSYQHLNAYRSGGGNSWNNGRGHQERRPGQGTTPRNTHYMGKVQDLFWCDARKEQRAPPHATDCNQHECFVFQGEKQETNTGGKAKMPDHYRCTITCAFCGKCKHYEDEWYHKQRLCNKLWSAAQSGGGGAGGKSQGAKGKGKSQGQSKGQGQAQGKGGGRRHPEKKNNNKNQHKNQDSLGGNPNPSSRGTNPQPSCGMQNTGPTTCFQTQAQQAQGTKRANEMWTSLTPANVPASCVRRENCRRGGLK